jgi:hypothetical protein
MLTTCFFFDRRSLQRLAIIGCLVMTLLTERMVSGQSSTIATTNLDLQHVGHLIGLEGVKPNLYGELTFDDNAMQFKSGDLQNKVPLQAIRAFSIVRDNVALIGGTTGAVVGLAPFGIGQVTSAVRPSVDTFALLYTDENNAIHGAILLLPQGKGGDVSKRLATVGLTPSDYPKTGSLDNKPVANRSEVKKELAAEHGHPSVEVELFSESADGIPAAFPLTAYENLVTDMSKSGMFEHIWRQGDKRIDPGALVLKVSLQKLKKGSARARAIVPFTGATVLTIDLQLRDAAGHILLQKQIDASKRLRGENLEVTKGLSKRICKEITETAGLKRFQTTQGMD